MTNLGPTIIAKSDQLNADDLLGRSITIKITAVKGGNAEQPIAISYEGDNDKPYKPGKSMRRVLVWCWGDDGNNYVGRWLTLYRDGNVSFGGVRVGGIRISHMTHIDATKTMALTQTRGSKKEFTVQPMPVPQQQAQAVAMTPAEIDALKATGLTEAAKGSEALKKWWSTIGGQKQQQLGTVYRDSVKEIGAQSDAARNATSGLSLDDKSGNAGSPTSS